MKFQHYDVLLGVRISKEMKDRLDEMSAKLHLSDGEIMRDALDKYFKSIEKFGPNIFPLVAHALENINGKNHAQEKIEAPQKGDYDVT